MLAVGQSVGQKNDYPKMPCDTAHSDFRSTFRDWAARNGVDRVVAEKCLMHATGNAVEQTYQRDDLCELRRPVMQSWADEVLPLE